MTRKTENEMQQNTIVENILRKDEYTDEVIKLILLLMEEVKQEENVFHAVDDARKKKKMFSLYSKIDKDVREFIDQYFNQIRQKAEQMQKELDSCIEETQRLENEKESLQKSLEQLRSENEALLSQEIQIKQRQYKYVKLNQDLEKLQEEEEQILGVDGQNIEHLYEQKEVLAKKTEQLTEENRQLYQLVDIFKNLTIREHDAHFDSNIEEVWKENEQYFDVADQEVRNLFIHMKETVMGKNRQMEELRQMEKNLQDGVERYEDFFKSDSDFNIDLEKAGFKSSEDAYNQAVEMVKDMEHILGQQDEILADVVAKGEADRQRIERKQNR